METTLLDYISLTE